MAAPNDNIVASKVNVNTVIASKKHKMTTEEQFKAAVNVIRGLPKDGPFQPSDDLKLKFYAYFKQATEGPNNTPKPAFYNIVNKYKWDAWKKLGDMSKQRAMEGYIGELKKIIETMSFNENVTDFYNVLGPFYDFLPPESIAALPIPLHKVNGDAIAPLENEIMSETEIIKVKKFPVNRQSKDVSQTNGNQNYVNANDADSEADEFSDTYDHVAEDEEIPIAVRNGTQFGQSRTTDVIEARGGNDSNPLRTLSPSTSSINRNVSSSQSRSGRELRNPSLLGSTTMIGSGGAGGGSGSSHHDYTIGINEQLALAVIRLQQSMDQVVNRLDVLESVLTGDRTVSSSRVKPNRWSKWFPLSDLSSQTVVLLLVWPFVAHLIIHLIQQKRKK